MLYQLLEKGYPSFMLHENGLYKVQTGAYQQIGNAVNMEQRLRDDGYSTIIVTNSFWKYWKSADFLFNRIK